MADGLGRVILHRDRFARCIGLGDRKNPCTKTPALVQLEGEDLPSELAPFHSTTSMTLPRELVVEARLPLSPNDFTKNGPHFRANLGHVLPPSLENADAGEKASSSLLLPVSWQRLHHDEGLTQLEEQPDIVVLTDAHQLARQSDKLVRAIHSIKSAFPSALLWTPGIGGPDNMAVLSWIGVDLFDSGRCIQAAEEHAYLAPMGARFIESDEQYDHMVQLNAWHEIRVQVIQAMKNGSLRELAEQQALNSPRLIEHLRYHRNLLQLNDGFLARNKKSTNGFRCYSTQSFNDPLVTDWVHYIKNKYVTPSDYGDVLVLLPCSERKPYRLSRSHYKFLDILSSHHYEQLMVTSPLGLVPRNLEDVWPASHYDIPVTGEWDNDELQRIQTSLYSFLARHSFKLIINHSSVSFTWGGADVVDTRKNAGALSSESLSNLHRAVRDAAERFPVKRQKNSQRLLRKFEQISMKNLKNGNWLDGCNIRGKPPRWKIEKDGVQLAIWSIDRNAFSFSKQAIQVLHEHRSLLEVHLNSNLKWKGDIFNYMVDTFDASIRKDDDLLVYQDGEVLGLARALAPAWEWMNGIGALAKLHQKK